MGRTCALVCLSGHVGLLDQFLAYYTGLGVQTFLVHINDQGGEGEIVGAARPVIARYPCVLTEVWTGRFDYYRRVACDARAMTKHCGEDDWVLLPDLDEFSEFSMPLTELLPSCSESGYNALRGTFVDRVTANGVLPTFSECECVFSQYPCTARITWPVLRAQTSVVAAVRGTVIRNRHFTNDGSAILSGGPLRFHPRENAKVHHFKWSQNAVERMRARYLWYRELHLSGRSGFGFYREGKRLLDYLDAHGGRFDVSSPSLKITHDGRCLFRQHPAGVACVCHRSGHGGQEDAEAG